MIVCDGEAARYLALRVALYGPSWRRIEYAACDEAISGPIC